MRKLATANENPDVYKIEATCDGSGWDQEGKVPCYQRWEVCASDIYYRNHTDYGGCTDTYYGFVCPECGCFTELDNRKIPTTVKHNAKKYIKPSSYSSEK